MSPRLFAAIVLAGAAALGCEGTPVATLDPNAQGDPSAPLLIRGQIVDAAGRPIAGAQLGLSVSDFAHSQVGQPVKVLFNRTFIAAADGTFALHVAADATLAAIANTNGGYVNFDLLALTPDGRVVRPFAFPRQVAGAGWAGDVPTVVINPNGYEDVGNPAVTVPPPAAS
ncbi:MAG TPA: hypothetical protein VNH13_00385 [Candidatus Acidoferrales bacterium]|jgi:hypothetical protein|nr:hypothetical protein [Candidatus Acidoferrales bacterium]